MLGREILPDGPDQFLLRELPSGNHAGERVQEFRHTYLQIVLRVGDGPESAHPLPCTSVRENIRLSVPGTV
jgi:hypothetical protein